MSLSFNRHCAETALQRAIRRCKATAYTPPPLRRDDTAIRRRACRLADTPHPCSCDTCCNPRRSGWAKGKEKLSLQERKRKINITNNE